MIFDFVSGEMRRVKMDYKDHVYESLHHALQPCSVCHKLLAIDVDAQGEIRSSGINFRYQPDILPDHVHDDYPEGVKHLHILCCDRATALERRI